MLQAPWNEVLAQRLARFPVYAVEPEPRRNTSCHRQRGVELNLTCEGTGVLQVGKEDFAVTPGTLLVIPEGVSHQLLAVGPSRYVRAVLCVEASRLPGRLSERAEFQAAGRVLLSPGNAAVFQSLIERLAEETRLQPPCWEEVCVGLAMEAMVLALRAAVAERENPSGKADSLPSRVAKYVGCHLEENLSLEHIAAHFAVSREHLSRVFSREFGIPLHRFVVTTRIGEARKMLRENPAWTVLDVALAAGFQSHAHFSRVFRDVEGVTPSQYRTLQRLG
jgi:AraC-like DNA-binding protein/mannose-6-phosphate isomerase-like protein (cupin superfamily)